MTTVRDARDAYLDENGFTVAAYTEPWNDVTIFGIKTKIRNTRARAALIPMHDLHHVATGFGTAYAGEGEISGWEVGAGLPSSLYVAGIILGGFLLGLCVAPRRTLAAFAAGREARSLFRDAPPYEELLALSVAELRATLGVPAGGISRGPRRLHKHAPRAADRATATT